MVANSMRVENSLPDICELEASIDLKKEDGNSVSCIVGLRLCSTEIPIGDEDCEICFQKMVLSLDLDGLKVVAGSRLGEPRKENQVSVSKVQKSSKKRSSQSAAVVGVDSQKGVVGRISAAFASGKEEEENQEINQFQNDYRVKARPNLRWEISEPDGSALDGTYLENDCICRLNREIGSNRGSVKIEIRVKQRDLLINQINTTQSAIKYFSKLSINQRRLFDIFIAKTLSGEIRRGKDYGGELIVSRFEVDDEE